MAEQQLPVWNSKGVEPPANLQREGWQPGVKPPAQYFDWLFNRAYECLEELQAITEALETNKANGTDLTTLNNKVTKHLDESKVIMVFTKNTNQSIATHIITNMLFQIQSKGEFATLENGRIKILKEGLYQITAKAVFSQNSQGSRMVTVNDITQSTLAGNYVTTDVVTVGQIYVTANSFVNITVMQTSENALDLSSYSMVYLVKMG